MNEFVIKRIHYSLIPWHKYLKDLESVLLFIHKSHEMIVFHVNWVSFHSKIIWCFSHCIIFSVIACLQKEKSCAVVCCAPIISCSYSRVWIKYLNEALNDTLLNNLCIWADLWENLLKYELWVNPILFLSNQPLIQRMSTFLYKLCNSLNDCIRFAFILKNWFSNIFWSLSQNFAIMAEIIEKWLIHTMPNFCLFQTYSCIRIIARFNF